VQSIHPDDPEPVGCARNVMLCTCSTCLTSTNPITPAGPLHTYLEQCFAQDVADAKVGGHEPPVNLLSMPQLDPRTGAHKPTKKQATALIKQIGAEALSSEVVAAYA
jgi:hypothetical protein